MSVPHYPRRPVIFMATPSSSHRRPDLSPLAQPDCDPFRFGWRWVRLASTNGVLGESQCVPLTTDDLLHPQEGDGIPENTIQERDRTYLASVLRLRCAIRPVFASCQTVWWTGECRAWATIPPTSVSSRRCAIGVGGRLSSSRAARSSAAAGDRDRVAGRLGPQGVTTTWSPRSGHYYRAGVPLYAIIDQEEGAPRTSWGIGPAGRIRASAARQARPAAARVRRTAIGLRDNVAVCWDARTVKRFST